jgi:tRNA modification GTPase
MSDTIFAQSTSRGRSGISIVRVSGPNAISAVHTLFARPVPPRRPGLRWLCNPADGEKLDQAVVLTFPGPQSVTGEDVAELHLHGSPAVCRAVLSVLGACKGLRPAEPGEFTRQALMNGRLDLAQVEGLGDLLAAETEAQRRQALRLMEGGLSRKAEAWRGEIVRVLAHVEVGIDFVDDDIPEDVTTGLAADLAALAEGIAADLAASRMAERIRDGFEVAIVGAPNVGKSTLLNALAGRDVALTSEIAGTTRDVIEVRMDLGGLPVTVLDTAGLRETAGEIEALGIARARARAEQADLRVFLVETPGDVAALAVPVRNGDLVVRGKADRPGGGEGPAVSGLTGEGIGSLIDRIGAVLGERAAGAATITSARQRAAVTSALARLRAAAGGLEGPAGDPVLVAEELRGALRALDVLVGRTDVEAVLDAVFAGFCLGK